MLFFRKLLDTHKCVVDELINFYLLQSSCNHRTDFNAHLCFSIHSPPPSYIENPLVYIEMSCNLL